MIPLHPILVDFQSQRRTLTLANVAILIGTIAVAIYLGFNSVSLFSEIATYEEIQAELDQQVRGGEADRKHTAEEAKRVAKEVKAANRVLAQLSLPWEELFMDVESSPTDPVALLSVEPDSEKKIITITGEAKGLEEVVKYLKVLQSKKSLHDVYLQSHHIEQSRTGKPVRFVLVASWTLKS